MGPYLRCRQLHGLSGSAAGKRAVRLRGRRLHRLTPQRQVRPLPRRDRRHTAATADAPAARAAGARDHAARRYGRHPRRCAGDRRHATAAERHDCRAPLPAGPVLSTQHAVPAAAPSATPFARAARRHRAAGRSTGRSLPAAPGHAPGPGARPCASAGAPAWPGNIRELENLGSRIAVFLMQFDRIEDVRYFGTLQQRATQLVGHITTQKLAASAA